MRIAGRIFLAILCTVGVGVYFLTDWIVDDLSPQYRELTEEPLVDMARVLAGLAAASVKDGRPDAALFRTAMADVAGQEFAARIHAFTKQRADSPGYITDAAGRVVFDSDHGRDEGRDYSQWNDVFLTLRGEYGSRTSHDVPGHPEMGVMYVAAPIMVDGRLAGVLSVGKSTRNVNMYLETSERKIIIGGLVVFGVVVLMALLAATMLTRPIQRLTAYAKAIGRNERCPLPALGTSEISDLGLAFEEMRVALEGKQYIENYVQNLTHEMKSPLAGITGAAELLREEMPLARRNRFLDNIQNDVNRMREVIDKLLLLSTLESRRELAEVEPIRLYPLVAATAERLLAGGGDRQPQVQISGDQEASITGEPFLVDHAVTNILQNAIDFSPPDGVIRVAITAGDQGLELTVADQGPGVPPYALDRVFERFYSLNRPAGGRKSSGLGLCLVREAMLLHRGSVRLENDPAGGARATLFFPA